MKIKIQKLHKSARVPKYASKGSACFDLYATTVNGMEHIGDLCDRSSPVVCGTGLAFEIPEGYMLSIRPRSGMAFKQGIHAFQGTIDSDFRGEVMILLQCSSSAPDCMPTKISPGDRIAQACIVAAPRVEFEICEKLLTTERGDCGFGSSGK